MQPLVSIIVPHFNRLFFLQATLDSVLKQTYANIEIIVVDDGSCDIELIGLQRLGEHPLITIIERKNLPKGPSHCRNLGVKNCNGNYLLFLDSDDLLAPFCIAQRVEAMENNSTVGVGIFKMATFTDTYSLTSEKVFNKNIPPDKWVASFIENQNPWNVTCPLWRKSIFENLGGFDVELLFMEDPDIHLRLLINKNNLVQTFYNLPVDSYYRINNMDCTKELFYYNSIYYRIKFYSKIINDKHLNHLMPAYANAYNKGILELVRKFLFARASIYPSLVQSFRELLTETQGMNAVKKIWILFLLSIASSKSIIIRKLHLKGFAYQLLPKA